MEEPICEVCNVKVQYIRPKGYENLRAWCGDENNEYIGRKGVVFIDKKRYPSEDSVWANPYKIGKDGTRDEVLSKYEEYILEKMGEEPETYDIEQLRGKRLGCWCHPEPCHGNVLEKILRMITGPERETSLEGEMSAMNLDKKSCIQVKPGLGGIDWGSESSSDDDK